MGGAEGFGFVHIDVFCPTREVLLSMEVGGVLRFCHMPLFPVRFSSLAYFWTIRIWWMGETIRKLSDRIENHVIGNSSIEDGLLSSTHLFSWLNLNNSTNSSSQ